MRLRDRVDVADRDEAVGRVHVVALGDEPAEEAALRRRRQGSPPPRLRRRAPRRAGRPRRRRATACSRRRSRGPGRSTRTRSVEPTRDAQRRRRELVRERAQPRASLLLHRASAPVSAAAVAVPGRGEYGNACTCVIPRARTTSRVRANAASSSPGKPTMTSAVRLKSRERLELREVLRRRVAAAHRAEHAVVARLQRDVEMERRGRRLAERRDEVVGRDGSPRSTRAEAARRPGSRPPRGRAAASAYPASRSRKQPRLTPVRTISR